jgi:regulator of ribonuclease activity A
MAHSLPDICDDYPEDISVLEPLFTNYGKQGRFSGEIVTIKCFEDNSLVRDLVNNEGNGKVIVVDGGGSLRRALLGDLLAAKAVENGWAGLVINGCVRDVEILGTMDLGIRALNCHPLKTEKRGEGCALPTRVLPVCGCQWYRACSPRAGSEFLTGIPMHYG